MVNFIIIIFCLITGILFSSLKLVPTKSYKAINAWVINIALPAMCFTYLPYLNWDYKIIFAFIAPVVVLLGSILFFFVLSKFIKMSKRNRITLSLISGFSNTSFVGFPLITAYYGAENIEIGILCDQMTFFLLSSLGVWIAIRNNANRIDISTSQVIKNIFKFPPLIACILAIIISMFVDLQITKPFFQQLASTITPLALFSIGLQLNLNIGHQLKYISLAVIYILFIAPLIALFTSQILHFHGDVAKISVFEMAMPALVSTSMVLEKYNLNYQLGNSIIGISIFGGLVSTYFWYLLI